jgi:hypothetical protein
MMRRRSPANGVSRDMTAQQISATVRAVVPYFPFELKLKSVLGWFVLKHYLGIHSFKLYAAHFLFNENEHGQSKL